MARPPPAYHGRFVNFAGVDAYPRPVQRWLPLVIGGHTPAAYRRAIARGHGWYGYGLTPERAAECVAGLKAAADRVQRPDGLGGLEISVTPRGEVTRELAERFAEAGVHRLVVLIQPGDGGPERTATSCRKTRISTSLEVSLRASSASQPNTRIMSR